jgi:CubicO group peptidase (beta-lactamase class C family)
MLQKMCRAGHFRESLSVSIDRTAIDGKSFEAFLRECLFDPLGMKDTAFSVPASKVDRLPGCYQFNRDSKKLEVFDSDQNGEYSCPPAFESRAGGLVSTVDDYYALCRMMLNKGV